jgi:hypothetical protein
MSGRNRGDAISLVDDEDPASHIEDEVEVQHFDGPSLPYPT